MSIEDLIVVLVFDNEVDGLAEVVEVFICHTIELILTEHHRVLHLAGVVDWLKSLRLLDVKGLNDHFLRFLSLDSFHGRLAAQLLHVVWELLLLLR